MGSGPYDSTNNPVTGYCNSCGKIIYLERKAARHIARQHHPRKSVYRCPFNDMFWHVGGLPNVVRWGKTGRDGIHNYRKPAA